MTLNWILLLLTSLFASAGQGDVPSFKGGRKGLQSFISQNLIYPGYSKQNCIQGTIEVSFRLTRTGHVSDSRIQNGLGIDLDEEALRIVRLSSGKWIVPDDFDTTNVMVMPVSFSLTDYGCAGRSAKQVKEAIHAYRAQEELTAAITNFYSQRQPGKYSSEDEQKIIQLKEQLGIDESYIDDLFKQAVKKLKQGDKQGACEDLHFIKNLGSSKADKMIEANCK